jgi:hypothetical protein
MTYEAGKYYWVKLKLSKGNGPCPARYDPAVNKWYPWVSNGVRFSDQELVVGSRIPDPDPS